MYDRLSILIVDDNQNMRALINEVLRALRLRSIYQARDGLEALEMLKNVPIDLALVDLMMPMLDGYEFTRMVRTAPDSPNRYLPILIVSGHATKQSIIASRNAGANSFLAKPITARTLVNQIHSVVMDERPFISAKGYFGPDRRRPLKVKDYRGPERRVADRKKAV